MRRKKLHPMGLIVCLLGISAFITGCETIERLHEANARPTKSIQVFRGATKPPGKIRELGVLTDQAPLQEQRDVEEQFIRTARRAGADALIVEPIMRTGEEMKAFTLVDSYLYRATMVAYSK